MATVAFIGLGGMGSRMAHRLLDAGHEVVVWNRTAERAQPLAQAGATVAATPADAAREVDVVITMVADPSALAAVTGGPNGVAAGVASPATVIEMSTVGPDSVAALAAALPDGVGLLDAPVLGSLSEAEDGSLRVFVGGPPDLVDRCSPLLSAFGSPVPVGPLGSGAAAKLVANTTLFGVLGILGEAVALADGLGLSRDVTFDVLAATPLAAQAERRRPAIESGEYDLRFRLVLARKDLDLVVDAAASAGVEMRLTEAARSWFADAESDGWGGRDYSAVLAQISRH